MIRTGSIALVLTLGIVFAVSFTAGLVVVTSTSQAGRRHLQIRIRLAGGTAVRSRVRDARIACARR